MEPSAKWDKEASSYEVAVPRTAAKELTKEWTRAGAVLKPD